MCDETAPRTGIARFWPRRWWTRLILIVVIVCWVIPSLLLLTATESDAATIITDPAQVTAATPAADIQATLDSGVASPAVLAAILAVGNPTDRDETVVGPVKGGATGVTTSGNTTVGCRGTVTRTKKVYIFVSVVLAWRRVIQQGWCWNASRITTVGAHAQEFGHLSGYCWSDVQYQNLLWAGTPTNPTEYRLNSRAELHINFPGFSCGTAPGVDSFRTLNPVIYYHRGGTYNFGT